MADETTHEGNPTGEPIDIEKHLIEAERRRQFADAARNTLRELESLDREVIEEKAAIDGPPRRTVIGHETDNWPQCNRCGKRLDPSTLVEQPFEHVTLPRICGECTARGAEELGVWQAALEGHPLRSHRTPSDRPNPGPVRKPQCPLCKEIYHEAIGHDCTHPAATDLPPGVVYKHREPVSLTASSVGLLSTPEHPELRPAVTYADGSQSILPDQLSLEQVTRDLQEAQPRPPIPMPRPTAEELTLFAATAKLPVQSLNIARTLETLGRVGLWPAVAAVAELLESQDGRGRGDQRWRELDWHDLQHKLSRHLRATYLHDRDPGSGLPPIVHVASRALMMIMVQLRLPASRAALEREPVILESPLAGCEPLHLAYLDACTRDALEQGWTPYASHRQLSRALDDTLPEEREAGISAGLAMRDAFRAVGWASVFYTDLGRSSGMQRALESLPRGSFPLARQVSPLEWPRILAEASADRFFAHSLAVAHRAAPALEGVELAIAARQVFQRECLEAWTLEHREQFYREPQPPHTERSRDPQAGGAECTEQPEPARACHVCDGAGSVDGGMCHACDGAGVFP